MNKKQFHLFLFLISIQVSAIFHGESDISNKYENVIHYQTNQNTICSGTIIHPYILLTAAHCVYGGKEIKEIIYGNKYKGKTTEKVEILETLVPKNYYMTKGKTFSQRDLALVIFKSKLSLPQSKMIKLINKEKYKELSIKTGDILTIVGFGKDQFKHPELRQFKEVEVLRNYLCADFNRKQFWSLEFGSLNGDSGGPAFIETSDEIFQVGVSSAGSTLDDKYCKRSYYTNLNHHLPWIKEMTGYDSRLSLDEISKIIENKYNLASDLIQKGNTDSELTLPASAKLKFNNVIIQITDPSLIQKTIKTKVSIEHCLAEDQCEEIKSAWRLKNHNILGREFDVSFDDFVFPLHNFRNHEEFLKVSLKIAFKPKTFSNQLEKMNYRKLYLDDLEEEHITTLSSIKIPANMALNFSQENIDHGVNLKKQGLGDNEKAVVFRTFLELVN